jgi:hypothetical protein
MLLESEIISVFFRLLQCWDSWYFSSLVGLLNRILVFFWSYRWPHLWMLPPSKYKTSNSMIKPHIKTLSNLPREDTVNIHSLFSWQRYFNAPFKEHNSPPFLAMWLGWGWLTSTQVSDIVLDWPMPLRYLPPLRLRKWYHEVWHFGMLSTSN